VNLALDTTGVVLAISLMALASYAVRIGGLLIMARIPIGPRVERFINAMSGSVLIAVVTPLALQGDAGARAALATTAVVLALTRKPLPAITAGIAAAALLRAF